MRQTLRQPVALGQVRPEALLLLDDLGRRRVIGQSASPDELDIDESEQGCRAANRGEVEDTQPLQTGALQDTAGDEVLAVVNSVAMPPRWVASAMGMSSFDGLIRVRRVASMTAGIITAAEAMLFMNSESPPAAAMTSAVIRPSLAPPTRTSQRPITALTPVRNRPPVRIDTAMISMTAELLRPENA